MSSAPLLVEAAALFCFELRLLLVSHSFFFLQVKVQYKHCGGQGIEEVSLYFCEAEKGRSHILGNPFQ